MTQLIQGSVSINVPDNITIPEQAGTLTEKQMLEMFPARNGIGQVCAATADSLRKDPSRLAVPGVTADSLQSSGQQAEDIDQVIKDVEAILIKLMQANRLLDHAAHTELRKVLATVRALEKFDPTLSGLVPDLIGYFKSK